MVCIQSSLQLKPLFLLDFGFSNELVSDEKEILVRMSTAVVDRVDVLLSAAGVDHLCLRLAPRLERNAQ